MRKRFLLLSLMLSFLIIVVFVIGSILRTPRCLTYTITSIHMDKLELDDSISHGRSIYMLYCDYEASSYEYGLFVGSIEPYGGGCSDSLESVKVLNSQNVDILDHLYNVDTVNISRLWVFDEGMEQTIGCYSVAPKEILRFWSGFYSFDECNMIPHGCNPLLLCLDNDSVVPEVIELRCNDRVIRNKVNSNPRKMILLRYYN